MSEEQGTKELKEVLAFILATANAVGRSLEDGDVSVLDVMHFVDPAMLAIDAFRDIHKVVDEFDNMTDEAKEDLFEYVEENFDIDTDFVEPVVTKGIQAAITMGDLICDFLDQYKSDEGA